MKNSSILRFFSVCTAAATLLSAAPALSAEASAEISTSGATAESSGDSYLSRYPYEHGMFELGIFAGIFLPSKNHNLQDENLRWNEYQDVAPDFGARLGYFPASFLGLEIEGAVMPTTTLDDATATLWAFRGHGILQIPSWSITPFALAGATVLGVSSDSNGDDVDPAFHYGLGLKFALSRVASLRLDGRDTLSQRHKATPNAEVAAAGHQTHHFEALLGLSLVLGRSEKEKPPADYDGDGIVDAKDKCPREPGPGPDGCPPPADSDGDGIIDEKDKCPNEPGPGPDGCPLPGDTDGDGFLDPDDRCPKDPGVAPDGCPDPDPDKDGIIAPTDKCPNEPETVNNYQDADGCPDEVPDAVKKFTGVIQGIEFDFGKATIRAGSRRILDEAAKTLVEYEDVIVEISGHTDSVGTQERNLELSQERADSVKAYMVSKGVPEDRIRTRGAGPNEPIGSNDTPEGRQSNRRIEFNLLAR